MPGSKQVSIASGARESRSWLDVVREQVASLEYGVVQITVHSARVTQIERTERTRFEPPASPSFNPPPDNWRE